MENAKVKEFFTSLKRAACEAGRSVADFFKKVFQNKKAAAGFCILMLFVLMAIFGPLIFPYDPTVDYENRYAPFSWQHIFGTDNLGRDVFRQLVAGSGSVLTIALLTGVFTVFIGVFLGILSGYAGGVVDKVIQGVTNIVLTIPSFPVMLVLAAIFTIEDPFTFALVLSAWSWAGLCRAVRAQVMSLRERDFIQICKVMKMSRTHIIVKELMPNIASYILINFIMTMRSAITGSVGIMMLGLAAYDPTNWGSMLSNAQAQGLVNPKVIPVLLVPLVTIIIFQAGAILFSNGLDEILNPRLRIG